MKKPWLTAGDLLVLVITIFGMAKFWIERFSGWKMICGCGWVLTSGGCGSSGGRGRGNLSFCGVSNNLLIRLDIL